MRNTQVADSPETELMLIAPQQTAPRVPPGSCHHGSQYQNTRGTGVCDSRELQASSHCQRRQQRHSNCQKQINHAKQRNHFKRIDNDCTTVPAREALSCLRITRDHGITRQVDPRDCVVADYQQR